MIRSHYALLGVEEGADADAIRHAYRQRMRSNHPDVTRNIGDMAYQLNEAYAVLSDPAKRAVYDKELERLRQRRSIRQVRPREAGEPRHEGVVNTATRFYRRPPSIVWILLLALTLNLVIIYGIMMNG
ncbi:J domain-containing protein [Sphingomicrobium sediminis]|uniref:J domain-containing protein n=1 Tax=Sphingomicrobium sediminis TaxID=2950949 RepID=A0A9X2J1G5_9SPHN|nr:J domain-containing protein [Sphingomicrobium sediminis]MCM8556704.1 J domain-containing protein [Sphingomicrobium sediminis]